MPRTKLHKTAERHRAKQQAKLKGDRPQPGQRKAIALDVTKIDWNRIDNPFILPDGVSIYE